jgi:hypothetical protein
MKREFHVRFCERLEGEIPSCLLSGSKAALAIAAAPRSCSGLVRGHEEYSGKRGPEATP